MKIETKLNINQKVFVMHDNKVTQMKVHIFEVTCFSNKEIQVTYHLESKDLKLSMFEILVFATKQELLDSL